jgi:hypothetical protein
MDAADGGADRLNGIGCGRRCVLNAGNLRADFLRRFCRLARQCFNLGSDNGKAFTGITSPCRLDRGVEGKKVRLLGDIRNQAYDIADLLRGGGKPAHNVVRGAGLIDSFA